MSIIYVVANTLSRSGFTPHNTLGSRQPPNFTQLSPDQRQDLPDLPRTGLRQTGYLQWDQQTDSATSITPFFISGRLSDIGDSSSLFSNTPPSVDFTGGNKTAHTEFSKPFVFGTSQKEQKHSESPIPFVFGASKEDYKASKPGGIKMVNERSPGKAPLNPVQPNEQAPRMTDSSFPSKPPPSSIPAGQSNSGHF